ncbi:MAG: DegV family EDD domain-containing protein [Candidatus Marinimicrobia bacterium]|nr:DegV family EDD domain-containing protein [Candidatus Neomarinimicrobiota bacterium]
MPVKIITDESSNLDEVTVKKYGISVIPFLISDADGKEVRIKGDPYIYNLQEDRANLRYFSSLDDYYNFLGKIKNKNEAPVSAAADIQWCREFLEDIVQKDEREICCILLAKSLSKIYDNIVITANDISRRYDRRIEVIDANQAFDPEGLLVVEAAKVAKQGKSLDEIIERIEEAKQKIFFIAPIDNLEYVRRSGRVPLHKSILTKIADLLGIVTIISFVESVPSPVSTVRKADVRKRMLQDIRRRIGYKETIELVLGYSVERQRIILQGLYEILKKEYNIKEVSYRQANKLVATHTGPNLYSASILRLGYSYIDSSLLIKMFKESEKKLRRHRKIIDSINIFPVNDSDTGRNMLKPIAGATTNLSERDSFVEAIEKISRFAFNKGGGCSGNALSQYLLGISNYIKSHLSKDKNLDPETFVGALKKGTESVYSSFGDPKEGTILSVMRMFGEQTEKALRERSEFSYIIKKSYSTSVKELLNPSVQEVKILRDSDVSDAGGLGFAIFLQGWLDTLGISLNNEIEKLNQNLEKEIKDQIASLKYKAKYPGFCVECSIKGSVEREEISDRLRSLPNKIDYNALIIRYGDGCTYVHIHVSDRDLVDRVIHVCKSYGYEVEAKAPTSLSQKKIDVFKFKIIKSLVKLKEVPFLFMYWFTPLPRIFFIRSEIRKKKKYKDISEERDYLKLVSKALKIKTDEMKTMILVCNRKGEVTYLNRLAREFYNVEDGFTKEKISRFLPEEIFKAVEEKIITGLKEECIIKDDNSTLLLRPVRVKRKYLGTMLEIKVRKN